MKHNTIQMKRIISNTLIIEGCLMTNCLAPQIINPVSSSIATITPRVVIIIFVTTCGNVNIADSSFQIISGFT